MKTILTCHIQAKNVCLGVFKRVLFLHPSNLGKYVPIKTLLDTGLRYF